MPKKQYPYMLCEKLHAELEGAEVCERSHDDPRERDEDDGRTYGHPGDEREERRWAGRE